MKMPKAYIMAFKTHLSLPRWSNGEYVRLQNQGSIPESSHKKCWFFYQKILFNSLEFGNRWCFNFVPRRARSAIVLSDPSPIVLGLSSHRILREKKQREQLCLSYYEPHMFQYFPSDLQNNILYYTSMFENRYQSLFKCFFF